MDAEKNTKLHVDQGGLISSLHVTSLCQFDSFPENNTALDSRTYITQLIPKRESSRRWVGHFARHSFNF